MARPRKDTAEPNARTRLIEAFWGLLEDLNVSELSIGKVAEAAGCNRGTFYYYFADLDNLVISAVSELFDSDGSVADALWKLSTEGDASVLDDPAARRLLHRLVVAIGGGAGQQVNKAARTGAYRHWRALVCSDGADLAPDACFAIQFMVSGVLGFLVAYGFSHESGGDFDLGALGPDARGYLQDVAFRTISAVARAQHMDERNLVARLSKRSACEAAL